jgi:predicted nucleic-acid-binding protein
MIAVDTNVLLRYVVDTRDEHQVARARKLIEQECSVDSPALVVDIVLCEFVWVMRKALRFKKPQIVQALQSLTLDRLIEFEDRPAFLSALQSFADGNSDLADYLIAANALKFGADVVVTFDAAASKHRAFRVLETKATP